MTILSGMSPQELVARTLMGEAGQEGELGMLAAAAVMDNRRKSGAYGNTFHDVILQPGQFSLYNDITGYAGGQGANKAWQGKISPTAWDVAGRVVSGGYDDPTGGATHYYNPRVASPSWANGKPYQDIGNHRFLSADAGKGGASQPRVSTKGQQPMATWDTSRGILEMPQEAPQTFGQRLKSSVRDGSLFDSIASAANTLRRRPDQNLDASIAYKNKQRDDAKRQNRTAEWLRSQGMHKEAAMVEQGLLTGPQLGALLTQGREAKKPIEVNGQLVDPDTFEVLGDYRTPDSPTNRETAKDRNDVLRYLDTGEPVFPDVKPDQEPVDIEGESALRKEFSGLSRVKDFDQQVGAYGRIIASADDPSAAGDLALIFNYMKLLDPGSVVRESEFATAQNAGGVDEMTRAWWNRLKSGERLDPNVRADFLKRAEKLYYDAEKQYGGTVERYRGAAEGYGFDPARTIPDAGYIGNAPAASARPRSMPERKEQPTRYTEAQLQQAIGKLSQLDLQTLQSIPDPRGQLQFLIDKGVLQ